MTSSARDIKDHRRRVLNHQEMQGQRQEPSPQPRDDPQLKMPLIGEVRRPDPAPPPKRSRRRVKKPIQPELGEP